ncbi:hypothetical protein J2X26_004346 [Cellulomonas humilata]|uniref:DUF676 domain-containing protein n=1 Tax=Cellulomonas humilata TaxID=144055 RepID=A0ABU0EL51_9CELL|nr:hypothetical protein [Cellulomonas humilata]
MTAGLNTEFPVPSVVGFLLDPEFIETWLGEGAVLDWSVGGRIVIPPTVGEPGDSVAPASTAVVQHVRRTQSSFALRAVWGGRAGNSELILRVSTRPQGRSRLRITETGIPAGNEAKRAQFWSEVLGELDWQITAASDERRRFRQALVVVHGIGQQRPTTTLRNFVEAVFPDMKGTRRFVKPDYASPLVGATSVTVPGRWAMNRPTTDVYELYWAHLIRDTTTSEVYAWAFRLVWAPLGNIPRKLQPHIVIVRMLMVTVSVALLAAVTFLFVGNSRGTGVPAILAGSAAFLALVPGLVWKVAGLFGSSAQNLLIANILGDASRYLDSQPANVQARQSVRETGLRLLDELHDSGRYGRIIMYGHSLGSVIAYDILAHSWTRRNRSHAAAQSMKTPALRAVEDLMNPRSSPAEPPPISTVRERQNAAWNEFTGNGFRWLVSDLVTAGSPLAHARWLLSPDKHTPFKQLVADRSMPTCPPQTTPVRSPKPGRMRAAFTYTHRYCIPGEPRLRPRSVLVPDHGALFALVRWSNLYFPHTGFLHGDPVGGPLQPTFGRWVDDIKLPQPGGGAFGFAHTKYVDTSRSRAHVALLRGALELPVTADIVFWLNASSSRTTRNPDGEDS